MADHLSPADLAELALGHGTGWVRGRDHLERCPACRGELTQMRRVVDAVRAATSTDLPSAPPGRVWQSITHELGFTERAGKPEGHRARVVPSVPARSRRRSRRGFAALLAAACLAGGAAGSAATWWRLRDTPAVVRADGASRLEALDAPNASGTVRLVQRHPTVQELRISVDGLPPTDGYFEVWLMDSSRTRLIAVGALAADGSATLPVPAGVDLAAYPLVDVSDQAYNGSPAHSGRSVVRGPLHG